MTVAHICRRALKKIVQFESRLPIRLFTRCGPLIAVFIGLYAFQPIGQAQTVSSECTNPVCAPGKPCAEYRCANPKPCLDCVAPPSSNDCVMGDALGSDANFADGNVPDVLIESTDYWEIDDAGDVSFEGISTTGPVEVTTISLPPSCVQTSGSFLLETPIEGYEGALNIGTFTYQGLNTDFYAWPQDFYDDGDRSFISVVDPDGNIDFNQYPWLSLGAYAVTGVNAFTGELFEENGTVELLIEAEVAYWARCCLSQTSPAIHGNPSSTTLWQGENYAWHKTVRRRLRCDQWLWHRSVDRSINDSPNSSPNRGN